MAGPAADNTNLRDQLKAAINEAKETWEAMGHHDPAPAAFIAARLVPLVTVVGDARYHQGEAAHSDLLHTADGLCSLILHRESSGLSEQTRRDLASLTTRLRYVTDRLARGEG